jgi:hypothetical protein
VTSGYRFPSEIIHQAIWLCLRFTLSLRDVEDLLAERGVAVSYETVRRWVNHFGPMIAADLRKRRLKPHATWHLDEVYLKSATAWSISGRGLVTRTEFGPAQLGSPSTCSGRGGGSPRPERFVSENAKRAAGGEVALDVECVVDGGVNGQETLGGSGRFETLHLVLAASCRLMGILGPVVCAQALVMASRVQFRTSSRRKSAVCPLLAPRVQSLVS